MRDRISALVILALLAAAGSLAGPADARAQPSRTKVAVVTLTVNNFGGALEWGHGDRLIPTTMGEMLEIAETALAGRWTVKPAAEFVADEDYRALSIGRVKSGLFAPTVSGQEMPSFTDDRGDVIKGRLDQSTAQELVRLLDVDAVVLIYSEWAIATGRMIPTSKPLAKNCVSMYDGSGNQLFYGRMDVMGKKTLGAMGKVSLNEETIHHWSEAFSRGLEGILDKYGKKLK